MTMVQHVENRIPLGSVGTNEPLHEFQIVHAIITQYRKNATADENSRNNNTCDNQVDNNKNVRTRGNSSKEGRSSFVNTICRTFNALAQATNPSLCAKQNISSHPTIASTVKNIISQFSGQTYHGSLCLASPCERPPVRDPPRNPVRRNARLQKAISQRQAAAVQSNAPPARSPPQPPTAAALSKPNQSTAAAAVVNPHKNEPTPKVTPHKTERLGSNSAAPAVPPKVRSVRARNANRLIRHVSAPIPYPEAAKNQPKAGASVRRSKSDAICYRTYHRRQERKIDSNVHTKVLHFENCCKGKGQAAMCLECRKHNLKADESSSSDTGPSTSRGHPVEENYAGALSYHKPSIITQSQRSADAAVTCSSPNKSAHSAVKSDVARSTPAQNRPKAVACPGGTYFGSTVVTQPTVMEVTNPAASANPQGVVTNLSEEAVPLDAGATSSLSGQFCGLSENLCSQKRKHSSSDAEETQCKRESREEIGNTATCSNQEKCNNAIEDNLTTSDSSKVEHNCSMADVGTSESYAKLCDIATERASSPISLCNNDNPLQDNESSTAGMEVTYSCSPSPVQSGVVITPEGQDPCSMLSDDSSDALDSSSSSEETFESPCPTRNGPTSRRSNTLPSNCLSPREEYLSNGPNPSSLRRVPSSRYRRMRNKLKKLISRPKSCPEAQFISLAFESQTEIMDRYLNSIRIPAPSFMLNGENGNNFSARRQQLENRLHSGRDWMSTLPDDVMTQIFSHLDTRSLAMLKCVCKDFAFLVETYDIRGVDSQWVKDERYIEDPCKFCRKRFTVGDVSMCRYHAKSYHCDLPYGRSYWTCCFQIERNAPGCRTGIHNNQWRVGPPS